MTREEIVQTIKQTQRMIDDCQRAVTDEHANLGLVQFAQAWLELESAREIFDK